MIDVGIILIALQRFLGKSKKEMSQPLILAVDDDREILILVQRVLEGRNYRVLTASTGEQALKYLREKKPDLVLLDLLMPNKDGLEICKQIKSEEETRNIPVIILSSRDEETDIVVGLELGADDYITKPFSERILQARIKAALRRKENQAESAVIKVRDLLIDTSKHEVFLADEKLALTLSEFRILKLLSSRPGWVFSRYQIVDAIHDGKSAVIDRTVDVLIAGLRRKLGDRNDLIETVRGIGYRLAE